MRENAANIKTVKEYPHRIGGRVYRVRSAHIQDVREVLRLTLEKDGFPPIGWKWVFYIRPEADEWEISVSPHLSVGSFGPVYADEVVVSYVHQEPTPDEEIEDWLDYQAEKIVEEALWGMSTKEL